MKYTKSQIKIALAMALCAAACFAINSNNVSAQQIIATWDTAMNGPGGSSLTDGGGTPPAPFTNNTAAANVIVYPMTKGLGIGAITTSAVYGGNSWTNAGEADSETNSIANGLYITYAVQAAPGYTISFSTNEMFIHMSSTGPASGELQYSTDGVNYTDMVSVTYDGTSVVYTNVLSTFNFLQNVPSSTTNFFRLVNWGATGAAGTWYIYNPTITPDNTLLGTTNEFLIAGSVTPLPPAQNLATWDTAMNGPGGPSLADGGGTPPAPFTNNTAAANVIVTPLAKGPGIGAITTSAVYGGNSWTNAGEADSETNSIANGLYITYAVQAAPGYTISFYTNEAFVHMSGTGPANGELQYSTDGVNYTDLAPMTYDDDTVFTNNLSTFNFLQNVPSTTTNFFRIVNWGATSTAGTWYIYNPTIPAGTLLGATNEFVIAGGVTSLSGVVAPMNLVISPPAQTNNAGQTAGISISASGSTPTYQWYFITNYDTAEAETNLIDDATNSTLTLTNLVEGDAGGYYVVLANSVGSATSAVATVTVANDPLIQIQPNSSYGLLDGPVPFSVTVAGTTPIGYQWWFSDTSGDLIAPVNNGPSGFGDGSGFTGATSSLLTLTNAQYGDLTNFVVVVTNVYGAVTSGVASLLLVTNSDFAELPPYYGVYGAITPITIWDFNGSNFVDMATNPNCLFNPTPYLGVGAATTVGSCYDPGTSPFSGSIDPNDNEGFNIIPSVPNLPDFSWGTDNYPANGENKQNGVQFNVSTLGAKDVIFTYDSRVSATASDYERVQYTTNGTDWIDYPSSSTFNGIGTTYESYSNSFVGFPGVMNNSNFAVRVVTECQGTATYGVTGNSSTYLGTANTYGTAGTVTYDLVAFYGEAITNNNIPPVIGAFTNQATGLIIGNVTSTTTGIILTNAETTLDSVPVTNLFMVSGDTTANKFTYSAAALNTSGMNPSFAFTSNALGQCSLAITPNSISENVASSPILVTVTDTNGDSTVAWFTLYVTTQFPAPTVNLISQTNTLVNTPLPVSFTVSSSTDSVSQFTYSGSSDNNTLAPAGNIVVNTNQISTNYASLSGLILPSSAIILTNATATSTNYTVIYQGPANPVVTITPAANQLGVGLLGLTVNDNDSTEPKSTTANVSFMVAPDTNVLFLDYFTYDNSGQLDAIGAFWQHLSGTFSHMNVNPAPSGGYVQVDTGNNTENMEAPLLGAPYANTSTTITNLFYSFVINVPVNEPSGDVINSNGTYFAALNDGVPLATADVEDLLMIVTNGVQTNGDYRVAIGNDSGDTAFSSSVAIFPRDLVPGNNYLIVTRLVLTNGQSTVWIDPTNLSSPSATAPIDSATVTYSISDFELRQSGNEEGDVAGLVNVSFVEVGKTFDSVLQGPQIANAVTYTVPFGSTWDIPISSLQTAAGWSDPDGIPFALSSVGPTSLNGTNVTTDGVNIYYGGPVVSYDSFNYAISDTYFTNSSGLVYLMPVLQMNGSLTYNANGNPVFSGISPVGAADYTYGVEDATNLLGPWFEAGNVLVGPSGSWSFTDTNHTNPPVIFYRLYYPDDPSNPPQ